MSKTTARTDDAARQRIARDLDRNLLVEAGAGSGKTHELAARMAAGVATGTYEIERLAAVTFTRKAAAELRGRFHAALEQELSDAGAAERTARLHHALANLERFFAGTIHAFCARLLRERPVEAGVSPGFTELDDVEEELLRQQSWRDYRAQAKAAGDPDLVALLEAGITAKQLDKAFEKVCLYEDVTFPAGDAPMPDGVPVWPQLQAFWGELEARLPDPMDPDSKCKTQERARNFARRWRSAARGDRSPALLADLLRVWESKPNVSGNWWSERRSEQRRLKAEVEELHSTFRGDVVLPFLQAWRQYLYAHSVRLLTKAREAAQAERRRRNALSFNDLLLMTARVLRSNRDVRCALQKKYRWLFVDEFQDTDPIQAEIMFLLAADESHVGRPSGGSGGPEGPPCTHTAASGESHTDWRTVLLRPGALFVVGDPKQSIYRFRRADIDIYNEVRARLAGRDGRGMVALTTNFRSAPELCDWANGVFAARFPAQPTLHAPKFAPLDAHRAAVAGVPAVAVLDLDPALEAGAVCLDEAERIARYIRAEVDAKRRAFGDFLILTRKKKSLQPYAEALERLQVPIEVTGAGAFGESAEVRHLALLLTALADAQDAVAVVGVLRGPFFGLSDRELFAYRRRGGWLGLFSDIDDDSPVGSALARLRRWHTWTRRLPAGAALERILEESGYLALAAATPSGVEAGDLLHAIDRVRAVVQNGFTLADAADALAVWSGLDEEPEESSEVDSLPLEPGRRDVVRLMNLHKAKGLEADVVFLADPLGGFDPRVDSRIVRTGVDATGYLQIVDGHGYAARVLAEPAGWDQHAAAELDYLRAEVDRLLYVAATRARDTLVIGRWTGKPGHRKAAWDAFHPFLSAASALAEPKRIRPGIVEPVDLSTRALAAASERITARHDRARQPSWSACSVTSEAKRLPRVTVEPVDTVEDDPTRALVEETPSRRADAGAAWGTLVHGLLEHAMRYPSATRDDLRRLAMWLTLEEPQLRPLVDHALQTVDALSRDGFWQRAQASTERHEEAPFSVLEPAGPPPGPAGVLRIPPNVLSGTIDLVYREGDAWRVVDYKTDADAPAADLESRHRAQLTAYERAWQTISGVSTTARVVGARAGAPPARGDV